MVKKLSFKRNPQTGYIISSFYASDGRAEVSIGIKVSESEWQSKSHAKANQRMGRLSLLVTRFVESKGRADEKISKAEVVELIKTELGKALKTKSSTLLPDLERYLELIKGGKILADGKPYAQATMSQLQGVIKYIKEAKLSNVSTDKFTAKDLTTFKAAMLKGDKRQNTLSNYTNQLLTFFSATKGLGWHENELKDTSERLRVAREKTEGNIPLLPEDLDKLLKVTIEDHLEEIVRDVFILGCNIGLRYSDITELQSAVLKDGILSKHTKKSGKLAEVPLNKEAMRIWKKYDGIFPLVPGSKFNAIISRLCKRAGLKEECLYVSTKGGVKQEVKHPKYDMVGSHTMRRTFAHNALMSGVDLFDIQQFLAHSKIDQTIEYLGLAKLQVAERAKKYSFFK